MKPTVEELYARGAAGSREEAARMLKDEPHIVQFFYDHWYGEMLNPADVAKEDGEW